MPYTLVIMIKFSTEEINTCDTFAKNVDTSFYKNRNQNDNSKRILDTKVGKLGEVATYHFLKEKYPDISYPDFTIFDKSQKSWDYDLKSSELNFHVKCQEFEQANRFGESWMFQLNDKHVFENYKNNDYVAFVLINMVTKSAEIKSIKLIKNLHENKLFSETKLTKFKGIKVCVYYQNLKKIGLFDL